MATLLHDAVMNPAEGNVSCPREWQWDVRGAEKAMVGVGAEGRAKGLLVPRQNKNILFFFFTTF